jgi:hypothetical protein
VFPSVSARGRKRIFYIFRISSNLFGPVRLFERNTHGLLRTLLNTSTHHYISISYKISRQKALRVELKGGRRQGWSNAAPLLAWPRRFPTVSSCVAPLLAWWSLLVPNSAAGLAIVMPRQHNTRSCHGTDHPLLPAAAGWSGSVPARPARAWGVRHTV